MYNKKKKKKQSKQFDLNFGIIRKFNMALQIHTLIKKDMLIAK